MNRALSLSCCVCWRWKMAKKVVRRRRPKAAAVGLWSSPSEARCVCGRLLSAGVVVERVELAAAVVCDCGRLTILAAFSV